MRITDDFYKAFPKDNEFRKAAIELLEASEQPDYNPEGEKTHDSHDVPCAVYAVWDNVEPGDVRGDKNHRANTDRNNHHDLIVRDHIRLHWLLMFCCADELYNATISSYGAVVQFHGDYSKLSAEEKLAADKELFKVKSEQMAGDKNPMKRLECRQKFMGDKNPMHNPAHRKKALDGFMKTISSRTEEQKALVRSHNCMYNPEYRAKAAAANKLAHNTPEYRAKMSGDKNPMANQENRNRVSEGKRRYNSTEEGKANLKRTGRKISAALLGRKDSDEVKKKKKLAAIKRSEDWKSYQAAGGKLCWKDWRRQGCPKCTIVFNVPMSYTISTASRRKSEYHKKHNCMHNPEIAALAISRARAAQQKIKADFQNYKSAGGTLKWQAWHKAGRPAHD